MRLLLDICKIYLGELMKQRKVYNIAILSILGIGLNLLGSFFAQFFHLPLYLDSFGTILVSAVSGYVPGIIVGFVTNLLNSFNNPNMLYFGGNSILIAVICAALAYRGYFKKIPTTILVIPILACTSGILSSLTAWTIDVLGLLDQTARIGWDSLLLISEWLNDYLWLDLLKEICDKGILVFLVYLILLVLPERIKKGMHYTPYERICPEDGLLPSEEKTSRRRSLQTKIAVILTLSFILVAIITSGIAYLLYRTTIINDCIRQADGVTDLITGEIDPDKVDDYILLGEEADGYLEAKSELSDIRDAHSEVRFLYVYRILEDGCHVVFDLETSEVEAGEPGEIIPFDGEFAKYKYDMLAGKSIEPVISVSEYGYLLTYYKPVYNSAGECTCYACVDFSMDMIKEFGFRFMLRLLWIMSGFFAFIMVIIMALFKRSIIAPINTITRVAQKFTYKTLDDRKENVRKIKSLRIDTKDEIENLHKVLTGSTEDSLRYEQKNLEQMDTLTAIANTYVNVFEADLEKNTIHEIIGKGFSINDMEIYDNMPIQEVINKAVSYGTDEVFRDLVLNFVNLSTIRKRLKDRNVLTLEYMNKNEKWSRCRIIASGRNEDGEVTRALWLTEDIDNEIRAKERLMESRANLQNAERLVEDMKEQVETLDEIAFSDALTGLGNKAAYDENTKPFDKAIAAGKTEDLAFAILMIDLNFLKKVNDTYGHENGNVYLKNCAEMVSRIYGRKESYRFGGDEFVAVLPGEKSKEAEALTEVFRAEMKQLKEDPEKQPWEQVSAAIGISYYTKDDKSVGEVFKRADAAMYENKIAMKAQRTD